MPFQRYNEFADRSKVRQSLGARAPDTVCKIEHTTKVVSNDRHFNSNPQGGRAFWEGLSQNGYGGHNYNVISMIISGGRMTTKAIVIPRSPFYNRLASFGKQQNKFWGVFEAFGKPEERFNILASKTTLASVLIFDGVKKVPLWVPGISSSP